MHIECDANDEWWWLSYSHVCAIYLDKVASLCAWTNGDTFTLHSHTLRHKYNEYCYNESIARTNHTRCNTARHSCSSATLEGGREREREDGGGSKYVQFMTALPSPSSFILSMYFRFTFFIHCDPYFGVAQQHYVVCFPHFLHVEQAFGNFSLCNEESVIKVHLQYWIDHHSYCSTQSLSMDFQHAWHLPKDQIVLRHSRIPHQAQIVADMSSRNRITKPFHSISRCIHFSKWQHVTYHHSLSTFPAVSAVSADLDKCLFALHIW